MEKKKGIGFYFKVIGKVFENNKNKELAIYHLTSQQFSLMMYLNRNNDKEINQKDIEKYFNLSSPTVTGLLKRLEIKGFIMRKTSIVDSRYKVIKPTTEGIELKENMFEKIKQIEEELLFGFSEEEKKDFTAYLNRILNNICQEGKKC